MSDEAVQANRSSSAGSMLRRGGATVVSSLFLLLAASSAMAAPLHGGGSVAASGCGAPSINVWYDADQFGKYLKVDFSRKSGCRASVGSIKGEVVCKTTGKRVYYESEARKNSTVTQALPDKSKCKSFWAQGTMTYLGVGGYYQDSWQWTWGNYPA
ncbi:hypothetical protein ACGFY3_35700 [Streptomyces mirabilis]|uniref:hypothetical protein n=1 Tax=Streptomyces mirabilis TaxID=68239 RepID=UPI003718BA60